MAKSFNARMKERFARITTSYDKANAYVHETAMMILEHAAEHKDCSTAQGLVMALPASQRREMLILWFQTFSPIVVKNNEDWASKMQPETLKNGDKNPLFVPFNLEGAAAKPWFELAKDNKERPALGEEGLEKLISQFANRLEKLVEKGEIEQAYKEAALAVSAQVRRIRVPKVKPANDSTDAASDGEGEAQQAA